MTSLFRALLFLVQAPILLADSNSNAVNERIPVRKSEMEAHWNIDCRASWAAINTVRSTTGEGACVFLPSLLRQLQLCAFIYQPPGEQITHTGPDYQAAINHQKEGGECPKFPGGKK